MLELIIFQVGIFKLIVTGIFSRMESTKRRARQPAMGSLTHGAPAVILGLTARGLRLGSPFASFPGGSSCRCSMADTQHVFTPRDSTAAVLCVSPDYCGSHGSTPATFHSTFYQLSLYDRRLFSKSEIKICWEQPPRILPKFKTVGKDKAMEGRQSLNYFSAALFPSK